MRQILACSLLIGAVAASFRARSQQPASIFKRADSEADVCEDLSVSSNDGNRKVAIVIDESSSMASSDPNRDSLKAAKELNNFLIANGEGPKPDKVTLIRFSGSGIVEYSLGDPGSANAAIDKVGVDGDGTYIAGGVEAAIQELTKDSDTKDRTAIVVFTDGEDASTGDLVAQIERAGSLGIRVSFGFLSLATGIQDPDVLKAVRTSRGIYATIADASGATNYVKYAILNGLTYNDNPQGFDERLLSGLAQTYTISGSDTISLKYRADKAENVTFSVTSISAGTLKTSAKMGGRTLAQDDTGSGSLGFGTLSDTYNLVVAAPKDGDIEVQIQAQGAPSDSLLSVLTLSDVPIKNCTIGVKPSGLSTGTKVGAALGTILGVALLGTAGYFAWKYFHPLTPPPPPHSPMSPPGEDVMSKSLATVSVEPLHNMPPPQSPAAPPGGPTHPVMAIPPMMRPQVSNPVQHAPQDPQQPQQPQQPPSDYQPPDQQDIPDHPDHPDRLPRIKRGKIEKHHHHHYLDPQQECLAENCEYNQEHTCLPDEDTCPCTCRDPKCPVTKERERIQREKDGLHTLLANAL